MKLQHRQSPERATPQQRLKAGDVLQFGQEPAQVDHLPRVRRDVVQENMRNTQELLSVQEEDFDETLADRLLDQVDDWVQLRMVFPEAVEPLTDDQLEVARRKIEPFLLKLNGTLAEAQASLEASQVQDYLSDLLVNLALYRSCFRDTGFTDLLSNEMLEYFIENADRKDLLLLIILRPDQHSRVEARALEYSDYLEDEYTNREEYSAEMPEFYEEFIHNLADFILIFPDRRPDFPLNESDWKKIQQILKVDQYSNYAYIVSKAAVLNAEDAKIDEQGVIHLSRRKGAVGQQVKLPDRLHA